MTARKKAPPLDAATLRFVADEEEREMRRLEKAVTRMKADLAKPSFANADIIHREYPAWIERDEGRIARHACRIRRNRLRATRIERASKRGRHG